jgi:signal transduction histidine kinase
MHRYDNIARFSQAERRRQMRELREQRKDLFQRIHESRYNEQVELQRQLHDLETSLDALHGSRRHRNPFERNVDFKNYYKHIRRSRYIFLIANITLWTLIFVLSGPMRGLRVFILVLALITTLSSVFDLLFLMGVNKRVLKPVENLKKGVDEIMKGNYTVVVDPYSHSEVSSLIDDFNGMARKLYEDEKLQDEYEQNRKLLIANISHDLKTPITSIQGYIEAIKDQREIPPEKMEKYLAIIRNNSQYMNRLIDDLFLFSKLDMQKLEFDFTDVDIRKYMGDLMEEFRLELSERKAGLSYTDELHDESIMRIDPKRFHQVVRNIIGNAVKYGPKEGLSIGARLYTQGGSVCLDVTDNGPGIPEDQLGHVFERFYRVDAERTKDTESTGLGLAIAKELVAAHGGSIAVANAEPAGTRFTITLPGSTPGKEEENEEHTDH